MTERGHWTWGLAPVTAREQWPPGHRSLSLVWPRPLRIPAAQAQGPPAWVGAGMLCLGRGASRVPSPPLPAGWVGLCLTRSRPEDQDLRVRNSLTPLRLCPSVPPGKRARYFSARDRVTQDGASLPILGPEVSLAGLGEQTPGSQSCQEEELARGQTGRRLS